MEYHSDFADPQNPYSAPQSDIAKPPGFPEIGDAGPARVRFSAIGEAWELASQTRGTWALIVLIFYAVVGGLAIAQIVVVNVLTDPRPNANNLAAGFAYLAITVISLAAQYHMTAGMYRCACRQARGEQIRAAEIFSAGDVFWSFLGGMILYGLAITLGVILFIIPGLLLVGRFMFVLPLIADGRVGVGKAMELSWNALRGQSWSSFAFVFVCTILSFLGALLCGIGLLITLPIYYLATAVLYNEFFLKTKPKTSPWITLT